MSQVPQQCRSAPASRPGLQSGQLHEDTGFAEGGGALVLDGADHVVGAAPEQAARRLVLGVHRIDGDNAACEVEVDDDVARQAGEDRGQGCPTWPLRYVPIG